MPVQKKSGNLLNAPRINQIGLKREDAINRVKWCSGVYELLRSTRSIRPPALTLTKSDLKNWISLSLSLLLQKTKKKLEEVTKR